MIDFTIAIPTYNGDARLPPLLARLQEQKNVENIAWEILIVDNNSTDQTQQVLRDFQTHWNKPFPLKYCREEKQGLAYARQRAISEAQGKWVAFLDDDIRPAPDWVANAYTFGQEHPQAGAYGGQIHGDFEIPPPENFQRIESFLAIRERGSKPHLYKANSLSLPPGAALVVNKQAWRENAPARPTLIGRVNGKMLAGEDYEILLHMHHSGWEIWYNPAMHVEHQIPKQRLEKDYLIPLIRGCGLCVCYLHFANAKDWQKPFIAAKIILGNARRSILHLLKYRWQVKTDFIAACELEFLTSSLLSPFFWLQQQMAIKSASPNF